MITEEHKELLSRTIGALRFPLMVLVIMIHVNLYDIGGVYLINERFTWYAHISCFITDKIARCAVPIFFIISGYLFFYKLKNLSVSAYKNKLCKRVRSLLVPYIIWNFVAILFLFCVQLLNPDTNLKLVSDYTFTDWLWAFWNSTKVSTEANLPEMGVPVAFQLWFIRDLMVVVLFSPVIYLLIKNLSYFFVIFLGVCFVFDWGIRIPGFYTFAVFFFSIGAYFSIHKKDPVDFLFKALPYTLFLYALITISTYIYSDFEHINIIGNIGLIILIVLSIGLALRLVEKGRLRENKFLTASNMFLFGCHVIVLRTLYKVIFTLIVPLTPFTLVFVYFIVGILTVLFSVGIYYVLQRYLPRFTAVLTGGR